MLTNTRLTQAMMLTPPRQEEHGSCGHVPVVGLQTGKYVSHLPPLCSPVCVSREATVAQKSV